MKKLQSYKVTKNKTAQVRIDAGYLKILRLIAVHEETTLKRLVEDAVVKLIEDRQIMK